MIDSSHPGTMIFHHPGPIFMNANAGSQVRPKQLLQAFEALGYEVVPVVGYGAERRRVIQRILNDLSHGRRYDFVYAESRSIPTLLTEPHHFPRFPLLDFKFLLAMRKAGVPVGLFYRDVFWRCAFYRTMIPWPGRLITVPLYWYDWWWYRKIIDHLFLPSMGMEQYLPTNWFAKKCSPLPPGALIPSKSSISPAVSTESLPLRLLYIGGITPPNYNLKPLLEALNNVDDLHLTICCRAAEWEKHQSFYSDCLTDRVEIVHLSGDALNDEYARAHVFALLWEPGEYLNFAVPVKLFESVGQGLPILTLRGTEAARIVEAEELGWVVDNVEQASKQLIDLVQNRKQLEIARQRVLLARERHTWEQRAQKIAVILSNISRPTTDKK